MTLTPLEIVSLLIGIVSLVFNVIQWRDGKASRDPLSNVLVGTFNEVKAREDVVHLTNLALSHPNSPHQNVATLRWEYALFLESELGALAGFREQLVSVLVSLRPNDKTGALAFRARDYGLTENDREIRRLNFERHKARMSNSESEPPVRREGPN